MCPRGGGVPPPARARGPLPGGPEVRAPSARRSAGVLACRVADVPVRAANAKFQAAASRRRETPRIRKASPPGPARSRPSDATALRQCNAEA